MVEYKLDDEAKLTNTERKILAKAKKKPIVYDDDSPEMTDDMEKAFVLARKKKPYNGETLTLYVSHSTIEKAKKLGTDYITILGRMLDKAVTDYKMP